MQKGIDKYTNLDTFTIIVIGMSMIWFAFGLTLVQVDLKYTTLCILGMLILLSGLTMGNIIHGYRITNELNIQGIITGAAGVGFVALAQLPALLTGLSIYGLSTVASSTLFLVSQAVAEELFFANFLYFYLRENSWSKIHALLTSSTIFAAFHWAVYTQETLVLLAVFLSRLMLNLIYDQAGLTGSITTHMIVNFISGVIG